MLAFLTIAFLHLLGVISPGPDFVLIMKNALIYNRRVAIYTALGIALGVSIHCTYCILGFGILLTQSTLLFNTVKFLGAGYLIYIGIRALFDKTTPQGNSNIITTTKNIPPSRALRQGFLCNAFNPKATLFFLGIFALVVKPEIPVTIQLLYTAEMMTVTFLWFSTVSILVTHPQIKTRMVPIQHWTSKCLGGFLVLFGTKLALWTHL